MAQTTNYGIPLIPEGAQDWKPKFDQIIEALDRTLVVNQKPSAITALKWGDITNGLYLESTDLGLQTHGPMNMLGNQTLNFVLETVATLPAGGTEGQLIYDLSTHLPHVYSSGSWLPISLNLGAGSPASGFTNIGLVVREDWGSPNGSVVARGASDLVSVGPSATGELLGFRTVGSSDELTFSTIGSWVGEGLVKGQFWVGTGPDTADTQAAPTSGDLLVGDPSSSTGWKFSKVADILPADDYSAASKLYANGNLG